MDTQLFFSFHPPNFDCSISHLQDNAVRQISSWMTAGSGNTIRRKKTVFTLSAVTPPKVNRFG